MSAGGDIFGSWLTGDLAFSRAEDDDKEGASVVWLDGAAVANALSGFALPLMPGKNMDWLAMAVRRSLAITIPSISDAPDRTSNFDIRAELERLAASAGSTWLELFQCDHAAEDRLWEYSFENWPESDAFDTASDEQFFYNRFKAAVMELDWLAGFMQRAAKATESQRGPWRQSAEKRLRVERGQFLALIFEAAFGTAVSANNYIEGGGDPRHKAPTPFMDFYNRMVTLAFGARETLNLVEVVKAACRLHRQHPVQIAEGLIPGL